MLFNDARQLARLISEGTCSLCLTQTQDKLILRVRLPEIFSAALPRRLVHAKRRLNKLRAAELTAVNFNSGLEEFGATWLDPTGQNQAAARAAFKQLRAYIFKPVTVNEAPKLLGVSADLIARLSPLPTLRIPCEHHGKRYAISGWKLSEFLELAEAARLVKASQLRQSGQEGPRPSGQGAADNA
ncbi:hypothetical protein ACFOHK_16650 [Falsigemmobacter intermedius]|uniref:Uncharacterized protein n=1 Tax=Falsigemmobacter intermedius TaxID=1553448 RepID=A0A444M8Q3_9RHOB|nr:hypothetical protein [Falsigemmobacter intermedius]RWY38833.1 hypothetical protein EP867_15310 [Falsigemmobacter intermedius]